MNTPAHPTEKYILGRLDFHESQAEWFDRHEQPTLAAWAKAEAEVWREKLRLERIR